MALRHLFTALGGSVVVLEDEEEDVSGGRAEDLRQVEVVKSYRTVWQDGLRWGGRGSTADSFLMQIIPRCV